MTDLNKGRELCNQSFEKYWDDFCEACGDGFDRSLAKLFFANAWGEAKAQAVLDTQQKLTDTYYLEGSDYVVDCPFEYDIEIDKGEVLELQKWQRTESTKVYFANIYKDEDNFDILQFASKVEAENAVAENLKFLEASESGVEG
ncbi:hypothetical protein ACT4WX_07160 [Acinetobacter baumannii]